MGGDITRSTFHRKKHYRKVRMQQGRVQLDSDWNEQVDIDSHYETTSLDDVVGRSGTPVGSATGYSDGFKIVQAVPPGATPTAGLPYWIMKGRYYVDGILCENEADTPVTQQPDLPLGPFVFLSPSAGPAGTSPTVVTVSGEGFAPNTQIASVTFAGTNVLPTPTPQTGPSGALSFSFTVPSSATNGTYTVAVSDGKNGAEATFTVAPTVSQSPPGSAQANHPVPTAPGVYVVYLDAWERELTCIEDPSIREVALLGPDTATRKKIVWQVKAMSPKFDYVTARSVIGPAPVAMPAVGRPVAASAASRAAMAAAVAAAAPGAGPASVTAAVAAAMARATPAAAASPTISLTPSVATPGTPITLKGGGFVGGESIALSFSNASLTTPKGAHLPMQTNAAADGSISPIAFLTPEVSSGNYTMTAAGATAAPPATLKVIDCSESDNAWTNFIDASKTTGRLRARAQPPAANSDPCIIPPLAGYVGLNNLLYRVEIHTPGDVPDPSKSGSGNPLPTFKWSRNNASVLAGITNIDSAGGLLTVTGTGKDRNLGFVGDPAEPPVWVEVVSDLQELWGNPGSLVKLTDVSDTTLTFSTSASDQVGPPVDNTNYPQGLNPKARRWDCSPAPCSWGQTGQTGQPDNYGYFDLENGVQVKFEPGHYNVGDYWIIPARTVTGNVEWPQRTSQVDWSKITTNAPAPSDSSTLADFLIQTLGVNWIQGQLFKPNTTNSNEIDISGTDSSGPQTLALTLTSPSQVDVAGAGIASSITVVTTASGQSMLQCTLPAPLPPKGIEHHFERLALIQTDGSGTVFPISDCRELFPALTDVPRLFYVSGDGQTANPDNTVPAPLMAATWFGSVRFTIAKGDGSLTDPQGNTVTGQGSFLDVVPGSGTSSTYPDMDGIASCSWVLDSNPAIPQQIVRAQLLDDNGNLTDHQTPLYFFASLQSGQARANTGIIELTMTPYMPALSKGATIVFGPFKHLSATQGVPPAIVLGYAGFRSSQGGDFVGRVIAAEDAGLYAAFSSPSVPGNMTNPGVYPWSTQGNPAFYLYPFSTQLNPGGVAIPLFKTLFVDDTYFCVAVDKVFLPSGADTLVLRWWAIPAVDKGQTSPETSHLWRSAEQATIASVTPGTSTSGPYITLTPPGLKNRHAAGEVVSTTSMAATTTTQGSSNRGQPVLKVRDVTKFVVGGIILIATGSPHEEVGVIVSIQGWTSAAATLTLASNLNDDHFANEPVAMPSAASMIGSPCQSGQLSIFLTSLPSPPFPVFKAGDSVAIYSPTIFN